MSKKYRGKVVKINPIWDNIKLLFISCTISNFKYDLKEGSYGNGCYK